MKLATVIPLNINTFNVKVSPLLCTILKVMLLHLKLQKEMELKFRMLLGNVLYVYKL